MRQIFNKIKNQLFPWQGIKVRKCSIGNDVQIKNGAKVINSTLGHNAYIGPEVRLFGVDIGAYASIGPRATIGENEHEQNLFSTSDVLFECIERNTCEIQKTLRTEIGADVWIGSNAFVRKGVSIGVGAIVGAHAEVLKDVPPYAIAVGVPARVIGYRFSPETCKQLEASRWWRLNKSQLQLAILARYGRTETAVMRSEQEILVFIEALDSMTKT